MLESVSLVFAKITIFYHFEGVCTKEFNRLYSGNLLLEHFGNITFVPIVQTAEYQRFKPLKIIISTLHRHEQRGTGRQEYLSPPKLVGKDKKGSDK